MPKSLAVRGKFVFDPEHGGGRRRRDKRAGHFKFAENTDKIGYNNNCCDLNKCFEINDLSDEEDRARNPFAMAQPTDRSQTGAQEHTEVNFLASAGTGESHPENIEDEEQEEELVIAPELFYS